MTFLNLGSLDQVPGQVHLCVMEHLGPPCLAGGARRAGARVPEPAVPGTGRRLATTVARRSRSGHRVPRRLWTATR